MSLAASNFSRAFIARAARSPLRTLTPKGKSFTLQRPDLRMGALDSRVSLASVRSMHTSPQLRTDKASAVSSVASDAAQSVDPGTVASTGMQIGDVAAHGLTTMLPVQWTEYALEYVHVMSGLPWWGTIGMVVLGYRLLILPINAWSQKHMMRTMKAQPEMNRIMEDIKAANAKKDYITSARHSQELLQIRKRENISMLKPLAGSLLQLPFMLAMFGALRDLATIPATHMDVGGALWFTNLMAADPYMILPIISAAGTIGTIELQSKLNSAVEQSPNTKLAFRVVAVIGAAVTSGFSSSLLLFWIYNTAFTIAQMLLFSTKPFRSFMGIPAIKKVKLARPPPSVLDKLNLTKFVGAKTRTPSSGPYVLPRKNISSKN
ncbi:hypothetical protein LPJ55_002297 [Coemansia sp. RSA 990]|nr:hypothetical protein LPJ55_002297 [Coemansia sp. RSA 990]